MRRVGRRDVPRRVVVDAEEIDRLRQHRRLLRREFRQVAPRALLDRVRVVADDDGIGEPRPHAFHQVLRRLRVVVLVQRPHHPAAVRHANFLFRRVVVLGGKSISKASNRRRVGQEDVVRGEEGLRRGVAFRAARSIGAAARSEDAVRIAFADEGQGLVEGDPLIDLGEGREGEVGVVREVRDALGREPASVLLFEGLRQVPVIERDEGLDAFVAEGGEDLAVEANPRRVLLGDGSVRQESRPAQRHPVVRQPQGTHQVDVVLEAVVEVVGDVPGVAVGRLALGM
mmetsp:Transcript_6969/g.22743  ORF Transcript_6969/g.22743 Transcript_6969/m.22743 type:complete len:285 (+) Transcript_6969:733-1587(+)